MLLEDAMEAQDALEHQHLAQEASTTPEGFGRHAAVLVSILAALLALAVISGNRAMTEALLSQQKASDAWNEFQANSLKRHINEDEAANLRLLAAGGPREAEAEQRAAALESDAATKYRPTQDRLQHEAEGLERERDLAERRHRRFEVAEAGFQLAIVLSSISIVARALGLLWAGGILGLVSLLFLFNGFWLWFPMPF
jgi:hypothetical protein